jgi:hypothetical protein
LADYKNNIAFILGAGLPYYEQEKISPGYSFLPGIPPVGITQLHAPVHVQVNQVATISGTANTQGKTTVLLETPGGLKDSVVLTGAGEKPFSFSFQPQQPGLFLYSLSFRDSLMNKIEGHVPVEVLPEKKLNLLFVQKFPSAEVRYLKNFVAEKGHALAVRSQLSKNDFHYEFSNREPIRMDRLTTEQLNELDLLVLDSESLYGFSASEIKSIEQSLKAGLGIIILMNEVDLKKKIPLLNISLKTYAQDTVHLRMQTKRFVLPAQPVSVQANLPVTTITSSATRILSGYQHNAAGKIGFQLLHETYRLLLEGKTTEYAALWSPLLESTARLTQESFKIKISNTFPYYQDEPLAIEIIAASIEPELKSNTALLPLQEDAIIDDYWHTTTWAGEPGWHSLTTQDSTALNYYVSPANEWNALRAANQQRAHLAKQTSFTGVHPANPQTEHKPISSLWFFIIFLLASGFLWLAPKL